MNTALDSSVIVAGLLPWHEHHAAARRAMATLVAGAGAERLVLPIPALVESYSVMTRLPGSRRLSPADAYQLLFRAFHDCGSTVNLEPGEIWDFLAEQRDRVVYGGSVYDAVILRCARRGGARRVLTLNRRHFERLAPSEIEVIVPEESQEDDKTRRSN